MISLVSGAPAVNASRPRSCPSPHIYTLKKPAVPLATWRRQPDIFRSFQQFAKAGHSGACPLWPTLSPPGRPHPTARSLFTSPRRDHKSLLKFHGPHSNQLAWAVTVDLVQAAIGPQRLSSATAAG